MVDKNRREIPRSLAFSQSGRDQAERRARDRFGQDFRAELAKVVKVKGKSISKDTVRRAFDLENVKFDFFDAVCSELGLDWEDMSDPSTYSYGVNSGSNGSAPKKLTDDELILQVREAVAERIRYECSQINLLLGHGELQSRYVEPDLLQLRRLPSEQLVDHDGLIGQVDEENYDRLGIHTPHDARLLCRQAVIDYDRLLVYGGPGSGKTSYLKWIAVQCIEGSILSEYVPVFLQIREFAAAGGYPSLHTHVEQYFESCNIHDPVDKVRALLQAGRILLILDGFDEIPDTHRPGIEQKVNEILNRYWKCRFVFSCRLPLPLAFSHFKKVLVAQFSARKTRDYVVKWFAQPGETPDLAERFLERLQNHRTLGELTRTPLLLDLLCIVFRTNQKFPPTRVEVYRQGIEELLKGRDQSLVSDYLPRRVTRNDITNLLRKIAVDFFVGSQPQILFAKRDVERKIEDYFSEFLNVDPNNIPASELLERLELRNGLLVSRSYNHCSFSHLTFQEYFTADYLVQSKTYDLIYEHVIDQEWRFVIELVAELLSKDQINEFCENFKQKLDSSVNSNDKICRFLNWINQMAASVSASVYTQQPYKSTLLRAWYFAFTFEDVGVVSGLGRVTQQFDFPEYDLAPSTITGNILESHTLFYRLYHTTKTDNYSSFLNIVGAIYAKFKDDGPQVESKLQNWQNMIDLQQQRQRDKAEWWNVYRKYWRNRVGQFMSHQHNLKCDWNFTADEKALLRKYYDATKLLSLCMNRSRAISPEVTQSLIDRILCLGSNAIESEPPDDFIGF